jgi:hypothetical protein
LRSFPASLRSSRKRLWSTEQRRISGQCADSKASSFLLPGILMPAYRRLKVWVIPLSILAISTLPGPALPHKHVDSDGAVVTWYPKECCHDGDCRPVASIMRAKQGLWLTTVDGLTVLVGPRDERRPSRDFRWHICIEPNDVLSQGPTVTCIFEPAGS